MTSPELLTILKAQHQELEDLFSRLESAHDSLSRERLAALLSEKLAVHTALTATFTGSPASVPSDQPTPFEALATRGALKRVMALLLDLDGEDETFLEKLRVLRGETRRRLEDETRHLSALAGVAA